MLRRRIFFKGESFQLIGLTTEEDPIFGKFAYREACLNCVKKPRNEVCHDFQVAATFAKNALFFLQRDNSALMKCDSPAQIPEGVFRGNYG
jgi:hypothetical protein